MYDMVSGSSPQTQGEKEVNKPAAYMIGILETKFDGSCSDTEAKSEAADCALYRISFKSGIMPSLVIVAVVSLVRNAMVVALHCGGCSSDVWVVGTVVGINP